MKNNVRYDITDKCRLALLILLLLAGTLTCHAQLNPFQSMYFQNRYLYNAAMAGYSGGLNLNFNYMQQWSEFPGSPKTSSFTADFKATDRVGLGLNINSDQAGLIRTTNVLGTYAYHLPLSSSDYLHFGISLGVNDSRLNNAAIDGDLTDPEMLLYNQQKPYVDGDLGLAYTNDHLYVGVAIPDLKSAFFKAGNQSYNADRLLLMTAVSYKIPLQSEDRNYVIEPLVAFRKVAGYSDIYDFGANFNLAYYNFYLQEIYHTSKSFSSGFGIDLKAVAFTFSYDFVTSQLSNLTNGTFEVGLRVKLWDGGK